MKSSELNCFSNGRLNVLSANLMIAVAVMGLKDLSCCSHEIKKKTGENMKAREENLEIR